MRSENERCAAALDDLFLEEPAKICGGEGIEAARRLVEKEHGRLMQQRASQAEPVRHASGERADLAVEFLLNLQPFCDAGDSFARGGTRQIVHRREKGEVLVAGEAGVETLVSAGVIAELRPGEGAFLFCVVAADEGAAARGDHQSGKNPEKSRLARAVGTNDGESFPTSDFQAHTGKRTLGRASEWMEKGAPARARWRKIFFKVFDKDGRIGHPGGYTQLAAANPVLALPGRRTPGRMQSHRRRTRPRWRPEKAKCGAALLCDRSFNMIAFAQRGFGMDANLSASTIVVAAGGQVSCPLGDEAAILTVQRSMYYGLDPVGARVWTLIQQPRSIGDLRDTIVSEYDVEAERCEQDLLEFLEKMRGEGLIEVREPAAD
jgi:hypothetical protein